jgi:hypothetical protein
MLWPEYDECIKFDIDAPIDALEEQERQFFAPLEPKKKIASVCKHWLRGLCRRNMYTCDYYHIYDEELLPLCQFFTRGECNIPDCMFRHPVLAKDMVYCVDYARGFCKDGPKCLKRHARFESSELAKRQQHIDYAIKSNVRARQKRPRSEVATKEYDHANDDGLLLSHYANSH